MRTAETIVKEYLERGYSIETLKLLAETRPEPLRTEMTALLDAMEVAGADDVACEETSCVEPGEEAEQLFFIVDEEGGMLDDEAVDFDIMAEVEPQAGEEPATREESVADIVIGETDGSEVVAMKPPQEVEGWRCVKTDAEHGGGIWDRLWSASNAEAAQENEMASPAAEHEFEVASSSMDDMLEALLTTDQAPSNEEVELVDAVSSLVGTVIIDGDMPSVSENSVDYIPGSVTAPFSEESSAVIEESQSALLEAQSVLEECATELPDAALASTEEPMAEPAVETVENADNLVETEAMQAVADTLEYDAPELATTLPRKERRRKERAERKKQKRQGKKRKAKAGEQTVGESAIQLLEPLDALCVETADFLAEAPAVEEIQDEIVSEQPDVVEEVMDAPVASESQELEHVAECALESDETPAVLDEIETESKELAEQNANDEQDVNDEALLPEVAENDEAIQDDLAALVDTESNAETEENLSAVAEANDMAASAALMTLDDVPAPASSESVEEVVDEIANEDAAAEMEETDAESDDAPVLHFPDVIEDDADGGLLFVTNDSAPVMEYEGSGEHLMIIAGGGVDLRSEYDGAGDEADGRDVEASHNVILFRGGVDAEDESEEAMEDTADVFGGLSSMLRMLPSAMTEDEAAAAAETGEVRVVDDHVSSDHALVLNDEERSSLIRAFGGEPSLDDCLDDEDVVVASNEHIIMSLSADEPASEGEAEADMAVHAEIEREYQERLDEFAKRLLEAQSAMAESESRVKEKLAEVEAKEAELAAVNGRFEEETKQRESLLKQVEDAKRDLESKTSEVRKFRGLKEEHERLYNEFEDLRRAYNEVVTDVMPELQTERDELILTVERQSKAETVLRSSLKTAKRRTAAGYALGAAACMIMVALPVSNWLKSGDTIREIAVDAQEITELRTRLQGAESYNIEADKAIVDLQREVQVARMELARLEERHSQTSLLAEQRARELSNARNGGVRTGNPSRTTSNLALQGGVQPNGSLRVNEVRDPVGEIHQTVVANRNSRARTNDDELALRPPPERQSPVRPAAGNGRIPVSSVARTPEPNRGAAQQTTVASTRPRAGETTATVKAGEGVAQVVYRVLGTRDPEVINWVIRENNIKRDRRGNPTIHPNQELRLPQAGRTSQAASATPRRAR